MAAALTLVSCFHHGPPPPPLFTPQAPYPPVPVDPYTFPDQPAPGMTPGPAAPQQKPPTDVTSPPSDPVADGKHPLARKTANPNEVISPYPPHHRIDITGFKSGQLARDPWNGEIFRIP